MTGIPSTYDPMWADCWNMETDTVGQALCEEAIMRILEPTLYKFENTVIDARGASATRAAALPSRGAIRRAA